MTNKPLMVLLILAFAGVIWIAYANSQKMSDSVAPTPEPTTQVTTPPVLMTSPVTIMLSTQSGLGQSGTAMLEEVDGKTKVTLSMMGGNFPEPQPAHIHTGMCPKPGAVVYPLTNVVGGKSETVVDSKLADLLKGGMALNVHKSAKEASVYTACGDLK